MGDQVDQTPVEDHRAIDVAKVLQMFHSDDGSTLREALQRLHVKLYHCGTERLQSLLRAAGAPAKVCNLVPQVVQACQVRRDWGRPSNSNKFTYSLAEAFNQEVQFDLLFYRSLLQPTLGGEQGIPICHLIGCCIRWSSFTMLLSRTTADLLNCISTSWVTIFGSMTILTLDGNQGCAPRRLMIGPCIAR